jgi:hypothetical protein
VPHLPESMFSKKWRLTCRYNGCSDEFGAPMAPD